MASLLLLRETMGNLSEELVDFMRCVLFSLEHSQKLIEVDYVRVLKVNLVDEFVRLAAGCSCWQTQGSPTFDL